MTLSLIANTRAAGQADQVRQNGQIPAVVYGPDIDPVSVALPYREFSKLLETARGSTLIDLAVDTKEPMKVLIHDIQHDPVQGRVIHVDLLQINMKRELTANLEIRFVGEAPTVKEGGGTLIKGVETVSIRCLPKDLMSYIEVDLSQLTSFDDIIHVSDLALPPGIAVLAQPDTVVAKVNAPLTEEQLKAMEETATVSLEEIEVEKKGKKEEAGEVAAEGEPAAAAPAEPAKKKE